MPTYKETFKGSKRVREKSSFREYISTSFVNTKSSADNLKEMSILYINMKRTISLNVTISYDVFDAYYRILKSHQTDLNETNYVIFGSYAITLRNAVIMEDLGFNKAEYESKIEDLESIIREAHKIELLKDYGSIENVMYLVERYIRKTSESCIPLNYFAQVCNFLNQIVIAGLDEQKCLELAYALLNARVIAFNSIIDDENYQRQCMGIKGVINKLENPTKKGPVI